MYKLLTSTHKELLLLSRDRTGLLVLFVMPAVLVLVISLVQENVLKTIGETSVEVLFVDQDHQSLGKMIEDHLAASRSVEIIKQINGKKIDAAEAVEAIRGGEYQFCFIIPAGMTTALRARTRQAVERLLSGEDASSMEGITAPDLLVYFDPTVRGGFRSAVLSSLKSALLSMEVKERMAMLTELLPAHLKKVVGEMMGPLASGDMLASMLPVEFKWDNKPLLHISEKIAFRGDMTKLPTSVQQNVPAWALFGMFFIVVPLAGSLIKERQEGTFARLMSMPVSYVTLLLGKLAAYVLVCFIQFSLIVLIGKLLLPVMGTATLDMGSSPAAVVVIVLSATLAATGYGVALGTIARTYEQASMFGPISVVIAAALGGIMVPVFAMPKIMQSISAFSPLAWGLNSFLEIFVRGGDLMSVAFEVSLLLLFFIAAMLVSWIYFVRRIRP